MAGADKNKIYHHKALSSPLLALGRRLFQHSADLALPPACFACGTGLSTADALCPACWQGLAFITKPYCRLCGLPFDYDPGFSALCGACLQERPAFTRARAALWYDEGSRGLIMRFKHADGLELAKLFGKWIVLAAGDLGLAHEGPAQSILVAPVPLHWRRLLQRRFNQASFLAKELALAKGYDHCPDLLLRKRATPPQGHLSRKERKANVRRAFQVRAKYRKALRGKSVMLVDDVATTGATLDACAQALMKAGARAVFAVTLARAVRR